MKKIYKHQFEKLHQEQNYRFCKDCHGISGVRNLSKTLIKCYKNISSVIFLTGCASWGALSSTFI